MASWRGLAQCDKCPHQRACDYRLPLGQAPNPLCPDGWVEGPEPAHLIPGPHYEPQRGQKYATGALRRERDRNAYQYSQRHFCLMCACWERIHTRVTNNSRTWLCVRHLRVFQRWKRKHGLPPIPRSAGKVREVKRRAKHQAILDTLSDGPRSQREIANALDWSVELCRFHLNKLAGASKVVKVNMRRGQSWIAWQLVTANITHGQDSL